MGNVRVPDALINAKRECPCIDLQLSDHERVGLLLEDYDFFVKNPTHFCDRLQALTELRGKAVVDNWVGKVAAGETPDVVFELLTMHYDPMYSSSIKRNFRQYAGARACVLHDRSTNSISAAATHLIAATS